MSRILFIGTITHTAVDQASLVNGMQQRGHQVYYCNLSHSDFGRMLYRGVGYFEYSINSRSHFLSTVFRLIVFCWRNRIDTIITSLEQGNFIGVLIQRFVRSKVIITRHHMDFAKKNGFDLSFSYRYTYHNAKCIVVVSDGVKNYMVTEEKIDASKISVIPIGYDFRLLPAGAARIDIDTSLITLVTIGRLDHLKRQELCIDVVAKLVGQGVRVQLFVLGRGERMSELVERSEKLAVGNIVHFAGFTNHVADYLSVADLVLHPSVSEASSLVVKEAGFYGCPVICCSGVGDFDDVIINEKNSFLVSKENFVAEAAPIIARYAHRKMELKKIGNELRQSVIEKFSIAGVLDKYEALIR